MYRYFFVPAIAAFFALGACQSVSHDPSRMRVMEYNIQWFSEDANPDRIQNLKTILDTIQPDVVGVEEVESKKALQQLFGDGWSISMADIPKEHQECGLAVRAPFKVVKSELIFPDPALDFAFPGGRDVLRTEVASPNGETWVFYVIHAKSRRGGRIQTDEQRIQAAQKLAQYLADRPKENSVLMGDFNDAPDDVSCNILESGNPKAPGGPGKWENPLMVNLMEPLYRKDYVTIELDRKFLGDPVSPIVEGAYNENEKFRGKEFKYPDDVEVTQVMFDQIMVRASLGGRSIDQPTIYSDVPALRGSGGRVQVGDDGSVTYTEKGTRASDHLPIYVDFKMPTSTSKD